MKNSNQNDDSERDIVRVLEYTNKMKESPNDPINYINRSYVFLKMKHYYYALEDAYKVITELKCRTLEGFKLMSEIFTAAELYEESVNTLAAGLRLGKQSCRKELLLLKREAEKRVRDRNNKEEKDLYISLILFCFIGLVASLSILTLDLPEYIEDNYPVISVMVIFSIMGVGLISYKLLLKVKRSKLYSVANPPFHTLEDKDIDELMRGDLSCVNSYMQNDKKTV